MTFKKNNIRLIYVTIGVLCGFIIAVSIAHKKDVPQMIIGAQSKAVPNRYDLFGTVWDATQDATPEMFTELATSRTGEDFTKNLMKMMDDRPASNVVVRVEGASVTKTTVSDAQGKFKLSGLARGSYDVSAEMIARPSGTGQKRIAIAKVQVDCSSNLKIDLRLAYCVTVKGRITDTKGRSVARAKITGGECPWSEIGIPYSVSVLSSNDGSYELRGFSPSNLFHLGAYLAGGNPNAGGTRFFVDIKVKADGFMQTHARVPAVTEELLVSARRLRNVINQSKFTARGNADRQKIEEPAMPTIQGNTITNVDIVMEVVQDRKRQTP